MIFARPMLAAAAVLAIHADPAAAQRDLRDEQDLRGHVVSAETGEPIAGAWVALQGRELGTYTRRDGRFLLPDMPRQPRAYTIEALGYLARTDTLASVREDWVIEMSPDPELFAGVSFVLGHLDERRNGARLFDSDALAFSGAFDLDDLLRNRGVDGVRKYCLDERWVPGLGEEPPERFYRMEIHGSTARVYTEDYLERMATETPEAIRRTVRPEMARC